jgi:hypothetical protein
MNIVVSHVVFNDTNDARSRHERQWRFCEGSGEKEKKEEENVQKKNSP